MREPAPAVVLEVERLTVTTGTGVRLVEDVDLALHAGQRLALVGESGSGKSVTARSIMRLDPALQLDGSIRLSGRELTTLGRRDMAAIRGADIGMVFQDPMSSLNPVLTVGDQVAEALRIRGVARRAALRRAVEMLDRLGIPDAERRSQAYPHEFSGGMRQRVVLAGALINQPRLLIADEPTTALDVKVQAQVLQLIREVSDESRMAVLFITHDLGIVGDFAHDVTVMYGGRTAETLPADVLHAGARHPYTRALLASTPYIDGDVSRPLPVIEGRPVDPSQRPAGCAFAPRCPRATPTCDEVLPVRADLGSGLHTVACHHPIGIAEQAREVVGA